MSKLAGAVAGLLIPAFLAAGVVATPAMAQDKMAAKKMAKAASTPTIEEIEKNDKVRVYEVIYKPGNTSASVERPPRVVRALKGGALTRIYPDGKKETSTYKNGQVKVFGATPAYVVKNEGKSAIHLFVVELK